MSTMYRAYQPTLPTANLYLQEKWDRSRYAEHRRKVERAVPAVNCKGFQTPTHLLVNMKKTQMDRDQRSLMEKQNRIHSTKLSSIRQSHGRVDNWNYYPQRSLNIGQRHQHLSRIVEENGKILERILKRESEYGRWKSEYERMERIRSNISRYPQDSEAAWAGQQTVTDIRRNVNVYDLVEGSKANGSQSSRSTLKLESIPQTAEHRSSKEPLYHTEKRRQVAPIQAEKSTLTLYGGSTYCDSRKGSTYSFHKRGTFHSGEYERTDHKLQTSSNSRDQKSLSNSENSISDANPGGPCLFLEDSDGREDIAHEDCVRGKCQSSNEQDQCTAQSNQSKKKSGSGTASYRSTECETVISDTDTKTHMYVGSNQSFDCSPVDSDESSCYSLQDSEESPHASPTQYSRISETLSSLSLDLKTRTTSTSPTSQKSSEIPENSLHKMEISNTLPPNISRSQGPSQEEPKSHYSLLQSTKDNSGHSSRVTNRSTDSLSLVTNRNLDVVSQGPSPEESKSHNSLLQSTKDNSGHSSRVTNRSTDSLSLVTNRNLDIVSQGPSQEESKSNYSLLQSTKDNSGHSSRVTNRSTDSLSLVTNRIRDVVSQGPSPEESKSHCSLLQSTKSNSGHSSISSSSTNRQRSPDLITQNTPFVPLTSDSRGTSDGSSKVSTKMNIGGKIYEALHSINEALYK